MLPDTIPPMVHRHREQMQKTILHGFLEPRQSLLDVAEPQVDSRDIERRLHGPIEQAPKNLLGFDLLSRDREGMPKEGHKQRAETRQLSGPAVSRDRYCLGTLLPPHRFR